MFSPDIVVSFENCTVMVGIKCHRQLSYSVPQKEAKAPVGKYAVKENGHGWDDVISHITTHNIADLVAML